MYEEIPDFQDPSLLYEGMTTTEREEVLRYGTDETGRVIIQTDDEGNQFKIARPTYQLKHYATDENAPIGLSKSATWFWSTNELVTHILRTEVELGLIVKVKKTRGKKAKANPKLPPAKKQEGETKNMSAGKRTRVTKVTRTPNKGGGKPGVAKPRTAGKRVTPKKPGGGGGGPKSGRVARAPVTKGRTDTLEEPSSGGVIDIDVLEQVVAKVVAPLIDELKAENQELKAAIAAVSGKVTDDITSLHDILMQTGGTLQYQATDDEGNELWDEDGNPIMESCPRLFAHPDKIMAYVLDTAFDEIAEPEEDGDGEDDAGE